MGDAQSYEDDHTLRESTDPAIMNRPDAYEEDDDEVYIKPADTVLVTRVRSCLVSSSSGEPGIAFQIGGIIGGDKEQVAVTHVASLPAIAKMVGQLIELAVSAGEEEAFEFQKLMQQELDAQVQNHNTYIEEHRDQQ